MIERRRFLRLGGAGLGLGLLAPAALLAPATLRAADADPAAGIKAIYARIVKGKDDGAGAFVTGDDTARRGYLTTALADLWKKAEAATPADDVGPVDFDPITNAQDPDVKSFTVKTETAEGDKATVAVTLKGRAARPKPADAVVRYDLVREAGTWKIDDIRGASDGEPWSIRAMLQGALKP